MQIFLIDLVSRETHISLESNVMHSFEEKQYIRKFQALCITVATLEKDSICLYETFLSYLSIFNLAMKYSFINC